jgi:hypothetical protein
MARTYCARWLVNYTMRINPSRKEREMCARTSLQARTTRESCGSARSCFGCGQVVEDVELATGEIVAESMTCPICEGSVSVYLYPKRRSR